MGPRLRSGESGEPWVIGPSLYITLHPAPCTFYTPCPFSTRPGNKVRAELLKRLPPDVWLGVAAMARLPGGRGVELEVTLSR